MPKTSDQSLELSFFRRNRVWETEVHKRKNASISARFEIAQPSRHTVEQYNFGPARLCPGLIVTQLKAQSFEFELWNVALVRPLLEEEFSASVQDVCFLSTLGYLDSYLSCSDNPGSKATTAERLDLLTKRHL